MKIAPDLYKQAGEAFVDSLAALDRYIDANTPPECKDDCGLTRDRADWCEECSEIQEVADSLERAQDYADSLGRTILELREARCE